MECVIANNHLQIKPVKFSMLIVSAYDWFLIQIKIMGQVYVMGRYTLIIHTVRIEMIPHPINVKLFNLLRIILIRSRQLFAKNPATSHSYKSDRQV